MFEVALERHKMSAVSTLTAHGMLDSRSAEHLATMLLMAEDSKRVIIDLAGVDLVDTGGLSALVGAIGKVREAGGEVELVATPTLSKVLQEQGVRFAS